MNDGNQSNYGGAGPLFEQRAKRNDPQTSHDWAKDANKKLTKSMVTAMEYIQAYRGHSAVQIEGHFSLVGGTVWKNAVQLERRGKIIRVRLPKPADRALRIYLPGDVLPKGAEIYHEET